MNLESVIPILEIGANIGTIAAAGFLIFEFKSAKKAYNLSVKDYKIRNEKEDTNKSIELAEYYAKMICTNIGYLNYVFEKIELVKYIEELRIDLICEFDIDEVKANLNQKQIQEVQEKMNNIDLEVLIDASNIIYDSGLNEYLDGIATIDLHKILLKKPKDEIAIAKQHNIGINEDMKKKAELELHTYNYYLNKYNNRFNRILTETLNNLEYFSMSFNTGVADEEVVYQSLHQSFLKIVNMLYFYIAFQNVDGKDKYFTNIIDLYNKWKKRYIKASEIEVESKRAIQTKKTPIKK